MEHSRFQEMPVYWHELLSNTNEASYLLFSRLLKHDEYKKTMRLRLSEDYPEMFKYLGSVLGSNIRKILILST